jgi:uncharacterized membrane protein
MNKRSIKESMKIASIPVIFASLCCLSPLLLFVFGLASVSVAASLADVFYGTYKWMFRIVGIILLIIGLVIYFRKKNICTFDEIKKQRTRIINMVILTTMIAIVGYILFLYVIVHYIGVFVGLWQ